MNWFWYKPISFYLFGVLSRYFQAEGYSYRLLSAQSFLCEHETEYREGGAAKCRFSLKTILVAFCFFFLSFLALSASWLPLYTILPLPRLPRYSSFNAGSLLAHLSFPLLFFHWYPHLMILIPVWWTCLSLMSDDVLFGWQARSWHQICKDGRYCLSSTILEQYVYNIGHS